MGGRRASRRVVPALMAVGLLVGACADDDWASDASNPPDPAVGSTLDAGRVDSTITSITSITTITTIREPESTPPATATTAAAPTSATSVPATTSRSDPSTTAPDRTTTTSTTLDEWDSYYPIEYAPGFRLRVTEPAPCDGVLRPAIVSANSYISPDLVGRGFVVVDLRTEGPAVRQFDAQILQEIANVADRIGIAVQWLRAHADEYCVAADAIAVTGYSYGALAALALAYTDGEIEAGDLVVVDLMGPPVVSETRHVPPPAELAAFSNDPDAVVAHAGFALADTIDAGEPPLLMFNGRNDPLIPFALAEQTCAAALAVDIVCEVVAHDEEHSFAEDHPIAVDLVSDFLERQMVVPVGLSLGN